jgi:lactoylglutathione lyase
MRIHHTMLRTGDLERAIGFYIDVLGMELRRRQDYPDGEFTLAFLGFPGDPDGAQIELTYNWGVGNYDLGSGYGHVAVEVDDVYRACAAVRERGGKVIRDAGPMNAGTSIIAFVEDPDGYPIELVGPRR